MPMIGTEPVIEHEIRTLFCGYGLVLMHVLRVVQTLSISPNEDWSVMGEVCAGRQVCIRKVRCAPLKILCKIISGVKVTWATMKSVEKCQGWSKTRPVFLSRLLTNLPINCKWEFCWASTYLKPRLGKPHEMFLLSHQNARESNVLQKQKSNFAFRLQRVFGIECPKQICMFLHSLKMCSQKSLDLTPLF